MTLEREPDPLRRIPTKHTADLRANIGQTLRAAREKRGATLETVAQQTRISKRYLEALENDRFGEFPAIVYFRGFLKGYCEYLDVDFDSLWASIDRPAAAETAETEEAPAAATESPAAPARAEAPKPESRPANAPKPPAAPAVKPAAQSAPQSKPQPKPAHAAPAHGSHAAPAAHKPAAKPSHGHGPAKHAENHHPAGGTGAGPALALAAALGIALLVFIFKPGAAPEAQAPQAPAALQPLPRTEEPRLVIKLKDDAWLSVSLDGKTVFEGRAPRGASQEWRPTRQVLLRTTAPAALELSLNGSATPLGEAGPDGEYTVEVP